MYIDAPTCAGKELHSIFSRDPREHWVKFFEGHTIPDYEHAPRFGELPRRVRRPLPDNDPRLTLLRDRNTSATNTFISVSCWRSSSDMMSRALASQSVSSVRKVKDGPSAGLVVVLAKAEYGLCGSDLTDVLVTCRD